MGWREREESKGKGKEAKKKKDRRKGREERITEKGGMNLWKASAWHCYNVIPQKNLVMTPCGLGSRRLDGCGAQSTYFPRDETGLVCLPTQLERTLQLYW